MFKMGRWDATDPYRVCSISLGDGAGGTFVNASSALNTFVAVNNRNVFDGYGILRTYVCTGTASDTVTIDYFYHEPKDDVWLKNLRFDIFVNRRMGRQSWASGYNCMIKVTFVIRGSDTICFKQCSTFP